MHLFLERRIVFPALVLIASTAGIGTFAVLEAAAREREPSGALVSDCGLYRKLPGGNALFSKITVSPKIRRAVLMISREPRCEAELANADANLKRLSTSLPSGNFLFLCADSGEILLQREIPKTRKTFELADEIKILCSRLRSVPVTYFPTDSLRGKIRTELYEGNAAFPVPAENGGDAK